MMSYKNKNCFLCSGTIILTTFKWSMLSSILRFQTLMGRHGGLDCRCQSRLKQSSTLQHRQVYKELTVSKVGKKISTGWKVSLDLSKLLCLVETFDNSHLKASTQVLTIWFWDTDQQSIIYREWVERVSTVSKVGTDMSRNS
jgi:hypothetical protein